MVLVHQDINKLLAYELEGKNNRWSPLGKLMHDTAKWAMRAYVDKLWNQMKPVWEHKQKVGWINPENKIMYDIFMHVFSFDIEMNKQGENKAGFGENGKNRRFMERLITIAMITMDDDTFYNMRFWLAMMELHDKKNWESIDVAMNRANAIFNYKKIYQDIIMREGNKLPFDHRKFSYDEEYVDDEEIMHQQDLRIAEMIKKKQAGEKNEVQSKEPS